MNAQMISQASATREAIKAAIAAGYKVPADLSAALALDDAAQHVSEPAPHYFDVRSLKATEVDDAITQAIETATMLAHFHEARSQLLEATWRGLTAVASQHATSMTEAIGSTYLTAADRFCRAMPDLPQRSDAEGIVRAGSAALRAFEVCTEATLTLTDTVKVRDHLDQLGGTLRTTPAEAFCRIAAPADALTLEAVAHLTAHRSVDRWREIFTAAPPAWRDRAEAAAAVRDIEANRPATPTPAAPQMMRVR